MGFLRVSLFASLAIALSGAGCTHRTPAGYADEDGGAPPPGGTGSPLSVAINWHQEPQSEILSCHYLKVPNDAAAEIGRIKLSFPPGAHHVHVYRASAPVPDHVEACTAIDWTTWSLVVGAQTKPIDWQLPDGVTVPLDPHEQLLVQVHWLNTTDQPVDRTINIELDQATHSDAHLGVVFGVSKDVFMAPGETKSIGNWCPIPPGVNVTAIMGHFHGRGRHYAVDLRKQGEASGQVIYEAQDEQTFQFEQYATPPVPQPGQGLAYECDYTNTTSGTITWGANTVTQEHCNMAAYYYPAGDKRSNLYIAGEVGSATVSASQLVVGQSTSGHLKLKEQAGPEGVDVILQPMDPIALLVPGVAHVPAWGWDADFSLQGMNPGRTSLGVTTGADVTMLPVVVGGLALSEVYYKPTASDPSGLQWVEIANVSNAPIDLSGYSLGSGGASYGATRASLGTMMLPPDGCLVVGGPRNLPPANPTANVFTVAEQFSPVLLTADTPADGVALFDVPLDQPLPAGAVPLDAVVYGTNNASQLLGPDGKPAVPFPGAPPGASLERTTSWQTQTAPTPGICRVSHGP